jgi:hypothetical protein
MLSWLERGLAQPGESGEITEFLIAPFQRKGEDRGSAKAWVDRVYRERESQETGAFSTSPPPAPARSCTSSPVPPARSGTESFTLVEPAGSLLATAWPALEEEVRARFRRLEGRQETAETPEEQRSNQSPPPARAICWIMPSPYPAHAAAPSAAGLPARGSRSLLASRREIIVRPVLMD